MGYTPKLPLMPYDALTYAISEKFNLKFGKAKISSDLINICVVGYNMCNFHSIIRLN